MSNPNLKSFGIVITTYSGDFQLTRGLLASIKCYAPDLPICLIQDGDFDIQKECDTYNIVHVIRKENVQNEFLRENCFGSRCTNMIAFWESPFEYFLYLDSDLVLWGNILDVLQNLNCDFIHNNPHEPYSPYILKTQYCDFERLFAYVTKLDYEKCHFFNAGVFVAKKGIFSITLFEKLFSLWKEDRSLMPAEPQGMINYMVFSDSTIRIHEAPLQTVVPVWSMEDLRAQFKFKKGQPIIDQPTVIHWAGTKPLLMHRKETYITPMLFYRKKHLKNVRSIWRFVPLPYLYWEEFRVVLNRYYKGSIFSYLKRKVLR